MAVAVAPATATAPASSPPEVDELKCAKCRKPFVSEKKGAPPVFINALNQKWHPNWWAACRAGSFGRAAAGCRTCR